MSIDVVSFGPFLEHHPGQCLMRSLRKVLTRECLYYNKNKPSRVLSKQHIHFRCTYFCITLALEIEEVSTLLRSTPAVMIPGTTRGPLAVLCWPPLP